MKFIEVEVTGITVSININRILTIRPDGEGAIINMGRHHIIETTDSYDMVMEKIGEEADRIPFIRISSPPY